MQVLAKALSIDAIRFINICFTGRKLLISMPAYMFRYEKGQVCFTEENGCKIRYSWKKIDKPVHTTK